MLVLAAGTITIALNGGIFSKAAEAGRRMQNVMAEEQNLTNGRIKVAGIWYDSIDDYIEGTPSANQSDNGEALPDDNLPIFVDSIEQCTNTSKKYILPDGYLYEYSYKQEVFTDVLKGVGYTKDRRIRSTGEIASWTNSDADVTGYIPCKTGDVVRVKNMPIPSEFAVNQYYNQVAAYDENKVFIKNFWLYNTNWEMADLVFDGENTVQFTIKASFFGENVEYIIINAKEINDTSEVYVNSQIVDSEIGSWQKKELYVPSEWHSEIKTVVSKVSTLKTNAGLDVAQFLLTSDLHFPNQSYIKNVGKVSAETMRACNIPFFVNLGDNTPDSGEANLEFFSSNMNAMLNVFSPIDTGRILATVGNHDGGYSSGVGYYQPSNAERNDIYFGWQKSNNNKKFGPDGSYYYIDDESSKTRYIMLNSFWNEWDGGIIENTKYNYIGAPMFGEVQIKWFVNDALNMPSDYTAIIGTHGAISTYYPPKDIEVFKSILSAYKNKTTFNCSFAGVTDGWQAYSVSGNFSNINGEIIAIFHGHEHKDSIDTTTYAVPFIGITSGSAGARDENAPTRTIGTATETAIDVVTIDKTNRKIYLTRLGAGEDRNINY